MKKHRLNILPEMKEEAFLSLRSDIEKNGFDNKFPIYIYEDEIIDGWNRFKACKDLEVTPIYKHFTGSSLEALTFILRTNNRRDLTSSQRACLAADSEEIIETLTKEIEEERRKKISESRQNEMREKIPSSKRDETKVTTKLAQTFGTNSRYVSDAQRFKKEKPEVFEQIKNGTINISEAKKEEKKEERIQLINKQIEEIEAGELPELKGLFDVISVDPPWNYEGENKNKTSFDSVGRRVANPYPEMSTKEIKEIELPLMNDSIVFLWTTHKFLPDALEILKEWNLEYKGTLVWNKEKMGMGAWFRMQCEFCLVGIKGKPYWENTKYRDILNEPRREHSRKPDSFFTMVEEITLGRRLEYFSREQRQGWEVFGNDINKF
tara:strand:+ start:24 stop:1160 length:1137 start_codon:yes stop_codon:yes gene_type:complete